MDFYVFAGLTEHRHEILPYAFQFVQLKEKVSISQLYHGDNLTSYMLAEDGIVYSYYNPMDTKGSSKLKNFTIVTTDVDCDVDEYVSGQDGGVCRKKDGLWYGQCLNQWNRFGREDKSEKSYDNSPLDDINVFKIRKLAMSNESLWFVTEENHVYVTGLLSLTSEQIRSNIFDWKGFQLPGKPKRLEGCFSKLPSRVVKISCTSSDNNEDSQAMFLLENGDIYVHYYSLKVSGYFLQGKLKMGPVADFVLSKSFFCYQDYLGKLWYQEVSTPDLINDELVFNTQVHALPYRYNAFNVDYSRNLVVFGLDGIKVISKAYKQGVCQFVDQCPQIV